MRPIRATASIMTGLLLLATAAPAAPLPAGQPLPAAIAPVGVRLPAAGIQAAAPAHTRMLGSVAEQDGARTHLRDLSLDELRSKAVSTEVDPANRARINALLDPLALRDQRPGVDAIRSADKADGPWSGNSLLANATNMNDEYVSLAESPLTGHLYAVFAATDLGGTDRDIHIARSVDGGLTWNNWEMPSTSADESMPDLAIDEAGYIHVVWIAEPGIVMRARSQAADDPVNWAWVHGLEANEPLASPSIAVSGGGDFARVFIACGWNTVNWEVYAYEWTLLFMHSSDGGQNIIYDYFVPDGYQDY